MIQRARDTLLGLLVGAASTVVGLIVGLVL